MGIRELIGGAVITVVIGGTAYSVNESDVVDNFANDTGVTQEQAEQYVDSIKEEDLSSFTEVGTSFIDASNELIIAANEIDCENYTYDWESNILTCREGRAQILETGNDGVELGKAYQKLDSESATETDISMAISLIDEVNSDFDYPVIVKVSDPAAISELKNTNSYNKAILNAALESK